MFYHFAQEVAVGGFFWGVLFFCSDSPHSEQSEETRSRTRGSFCCIGTSEAGLLSAGTVYSSALFLMVPEQSEETNQPQRGWCGGAGTVYSAVPFRGVQNNQNKRVAGLFRFAL